MFYYKYILGWMPEIRALPLVFGSCWHRAMDVVWEGFASGEASDAALAEQAAAAFKTEWISSGLPDYMDMETTVEYAPRTPMHAYEMLVGYIAARRKAAEGMEPIDIERPFAVPLDPEDDTLFYVGKIDKIVRSKQRGKIIGLEHKTTTSYRKSGVFAPTFIEGYSPNSQVDGYLYALHMFYPGEVGGVWVDGALVHKTEEGFIFIPIEKQIAQLDLWLWEQRAWIDGIEANRLAAEDTSADAAYLPAFPKRTENCVNFNHLCPYLHVCRGLTNPNGRPMPSGFTHEEWNPLQHLNASKLPFLGGKDGT